MTSSNLAHGFSDATTILHCRLRVARQRQIASLAIHYWSASALTGDLHRSPAWSGNTGVTIADAIAGCGFRFRPLARQDFGSLSGMAMLPRIIAAPALLEAA